MYGGELVYTSERFLTKMTKVITILVACFICTHGEDHMVANNPETCSLGDCSQMKTSITSMGATIDSFHGELVSVKSEIQIMRKQFAEKQQKSMNATEAIMKQQRIIEAHQDVIQKQLTLILEKFVSLSKASPNDCAEIYKNGHRLSGVYVIYPWDRQGQVSVYCDMVTGGGGWTVFQTRRDGSVNFYRKWKDYKTGFGNMHDEFWLGNDILNRLTGRGNYNLRVDLEDFKGKKVYAEYSNFTIKPEKDMYRLEISGYSGNAGDSLSAHSGARFSTSDSDNDSDSRNCAVTFKGAWWYTSCHSSNLNGLYHLGAHTSYADGVNWQAFKGYHESMERTEMKIRPSGF